MEKKEAPILTESGQWEAGSGKQEAGPYVPCSGQISVGSVPGMNAS